MIYLVYSHLSLWKLFCCLMSVRKLRALKFNQEHISSPSFSNPANDPEERRILLPGEKRGTFGVRHSSKCPTLMKSIMQN